MKKDLSIYLHIPFCERKCLYCDFLSFCAKRDLMEEYFDALEKEITASAFTYKDYCVKSVFFGGGTPSFPDCEFICRMLQKIKERFDVDADVEVSIEVNPASAMKEKLEAYRRAGFNRISIGAQSLNDDELKRLGRLHDSAMFFETFENARAAGFENINVDIMSALPQQSLSSYADTLEAVLKLHPEHISAYSLIVEEGTPFFDMDLKLPDEDTDRQMYHETGRILAEHGYHRYEISNYAFGDDEKYECFHNKVYWRRGNYLGLGLGASSMVENIRWNNTRDIREYISVLDSVDKRECEATGNVGLLQNVERLDKKSQMEEFMFLGLRLVKGVSTSEFERQFGVSITDVYGDVIRRFIAPGHLENIEKGAVTYLRLTDAGLDVSNTVMAEFLL